LWCLTSCGQESWCLCAAFSLRFGSFETTGGNASHNQITEIAIIIHGKKYNSPLGTLNQPQKKYHHILH
jgi:hypothetical protein